MTRRAPRRGGFTLFEVVGVVLVTAFVVGAATNYYIDLSRATSRAADNTRDIRHATAILDRMARDFESTLLVVKPDEVDPLFHPWLFVAEARYGESGADHLKFITRNFQPRRSEEHESDLTVVAYTVRPSEENDTLEVFRWTAPRLPDGLDRSFPSEDDEAAVLLAEGLADFGVTFFGDAGEETDTCATAAACCCRCAPSTSSRCSTPRASRAKATATKRERERERTTTRTRTRAASRSEIASTSRR
jgi:hypothetical protein